MGLRLDEGIAIKRLTQISGLTLNAIINEDALTQFIDNRWLIYDSVKQNLRTTQNGRLRLNALLRQLINES